MTEKFSTEWADARARGALRAGLLAALEAVKAFKPQKTVQALDAHICCVRAIERLLEEAGRGRGDG